MKLTKMKKNKIALMLGTQANTKGGIASVVNVYRESNLFDRHQIKYISTHCDGGLIRKFILMLMAFVEMLYLLIVNQVVVVHVHFASRASFWRKSCFILPLFVFKIPVIMHLHGAEFSIFYEIECNKLFQQFIKFVFKHSYRIVVLSEYWKTWVQSISCNSNVVVIYNPVLLPKLDSINIKRTSATILFLGRLGIRKGTFDLLDACSKLETKYPALKLLLGGDGEIEKIRVKADELGISHIVELLGWVSGSEKQHLLYTANIFVLPSYNEGLPMGVLEAMAVGLPIISTPVGGIPEAVTDGIEGFLVKPGDVNAIADRIDRLLSEPSLAERMGDAARKKIETSFSADVILPKVEKLYTDLEIL